ncbi:MAG: tetratricopeptide repeat protein [Methylocystis sp.]
MERRIKFSLLAFALSASLCAQAVAKPLEEGMDAYLRGDYATALKILEPLAIGGDPAAQSSIGYMLQNGLGLPRDPAKAANFFHAAADHGYAPAMVNLGAMFEAGIGVPEDYIEAYKWYSLAIANFKTAAEATARDVAEANRKALEAEMSESDLADAKQAVTDWKRK